MQQQTTTSIYHLLILLSRSVEAELMQKLSPSFNKLKMSYAAPMMHISLGDIRLNDLAQKMGISKQLCNQSLKPIEALGLIQRVDDHADGRAKLIQLSPKGKALNQQAFAEIIRLQQKFETLIGTNNLAAINKSMNSLAKKLKLLDAQSPDIPLASLLGVISRYTEKRLMELTKAQGFDDLQMSYSQVLSYLASQRKGITVSYLAEKNNISSQAISKTVNELELLDYVVKKTDSKDRRSKSLFLTKRGDLLIKASLSASEQLNAEIIAAIGSTQFQQLHLQLQRLQTMNTAQHSNSKSLKSALLMRYIQAFNTDRAKPKSTELEAYLPTNDIDTLNDILSRFFNTQ